MNLISSCQNVELVNPQHYFNITPTKCTCKYKTESQEVLKGYSVVWQFPHEAYVQ